MLQQLDKPLSLETVADGVKAAITAVQTYGGAEPGDRTMVSALAITEKHKAVEFWGCSRWMCVCVVSQLDSLHAVSVTLEASRGQSQIKNTLQQVSSVRPKCIQVEHFAIQILRTISTSLLQFFQCRRGTLGCEWHTCYTSDRTGVITRDVSHKRWADRVVLQAVERAALATAGMEARAGRASYVSTQHQTQPDAGAHAVSIWVKAVCGVIAAHC